MRDSNFGNPRDIAQDVVGLLFHINLDTMSSMLIDLVRIFPCTNVVEVFFWSTDVV